MATGRLREVEDDAVRIQTRRFRDQQEELEYQKSKALGEKPVNDLANPTDSSIAEQVGQTNSKEEKDAIKKVLSKDEPESEKGKDGEEAEKDPAKNPTPVPVKDQGEVQPQKGTKK